MLGEALPLFLGGPCCLAVARLLPASFLFPRTGWGTAHPTPLKPQGSCPSPGGCVLDPSHRDVLDPLADADEAARGAGVVEEQHAIGFVEVGLGDAPVPKAGGVTAAGAVTGCCGAAAGMLAQPQASWPCALTSPAQLCPRSVMWLAPHPPAAA